ncbi:DUF5009 domain-containing protein [Sinomicrobium soli]|nr:DUF5009 domain-containing protein [Sinomicrobium sp. N-1-3-6]
MFLLIAEAAGFHEHFYELTKNTVFSGMSEQLIHHPWHGLRFWDLIQPFFMFIVGVAMPFSLRKRLATGSQQAVTKHILKRCFLLFLFGVLLHCVYSHTLVWELWNVLVQLAFTILIAYSIMKLPLKAQWAISFALLLLTEMMYRIYNPGDPYSRGDNFGTFTDLLTMGKTNSGHWVFINFIPTASHTVWGVICGKILLSREKKDSNKMMYFITAGLIIVCAGLILDQLNITPVIKRIATSSFTLISGGIAIWVLALCYWSIDLRKNHKKWLSIFAVVGTNSIFIYLFSETVGIQWFRGFGMIFTQGILAPLLLSEKIILVINSLLVLFMFWYITYFLDSKKIYFRI